MHVKFVESTPTTPTSPTQTASRTDYFKRLREDLKDSSSESEEDCMQISSVKRLNEPCFIEASVESVNLKMEVDCGSAVSVIDERDYYSRFSHLQLEPYNNSLVVVDGANLEVKGYIMVSADVHGNRKQQLELVVLKRAKHSRRIVPLFGRKWLDLFFPDWRKLFSSARVHQISESETERTVEDVKCFTRRSIVYRP